MSRWLIVALCMPCLLLIGCKGKSAKSDQDLIQGTWEMLTVEAKGKLALNVADAKDKPRRVFAGDKVNIISELGDNQNTFTLNTKASPRQIDLFGPHDNNKVGIYELNGDDLKVCQVSADNGATRPNEFNSRDRGVLIVFRRVKS
jgi:uncharacterized protein (TIGR03067 family)